MYVSSWSLGDLLALMLCCFVLGMCSVHYIKAYRRNRVNAAQRRFVLTYLLNSPEWSCVVISKNGNVKATRIRNGERMERLFLGSVSEVYSEIPLARKPRNLYNELRLRG